MDAVGGNPGEDLGDRLRLLGLGRGTVGSRGRADGFSAVPYVAGASRPAVAAEPAVDGDAAHVRIRVTNRSGVLTEIPRRVQNRSRGQMGRGSKWRRDNRASGSRVHPTTGTISI